MAFLVVLALSALGWAQMPPGIPPRPYQATANMRDRTGASRGMVLLFQETPNIVRVVLTVSGQVPGLHAVHFHTTGICNATANFTTAGGHYNPLNVLHPMHAGDLPNITIGATGAGILNTTTDRITLSSGPVTSLFDADGTALIMHELPDNDRPPTGGAGARILCGVVQRAEVPGSAMPANPIAEQAFATLRTQTGDIVGQATFTQTGAGVQVQVGASGLAPGSSHGIHVHSVGQCVPPFTSAGGHFNPLGVSHPFHAADLPLLVADSQGRGFLDVTTPRFTTNAGFPTTVFDADGAAIIIHVGVDDFTNVNTGAAGARYACGVLTRNSVGITDVSAAERAAARSFQPFGTRVLVERTVLSRSMFGTGGIIRSVGPDASGMLRAGTSVVFSEGACFVGLLTFLSGQTIPSGAYCLIDMADIVASSSS